MKIGIVGAGSIGTYIASRLYFAKKNVSLLARGETFKKINTEGVIYSEIGSDNLQNIHIPVQDFEKTNEKFDLIIIASKSTHLHKIILQLPAVTHPSTKVIFLQNGIPWWFKATQEDKKFLTSNDEEIYKSITEFINIKNIYAGVVYSANSKKSLNHVENASPNNNKIVIGGINQEKNTDTNSLEKVFENSEINFSINQNVKKEIWKKLIGNVSIGLIALNTLDARSVIANKSIKNLYKDIIQEAILIAQCDGHDIQDEMDINNMISHRSNHQPSILKDYIEDKDGEYVDIFYKPILIARENSVKTPHIDSLFAIIDYKLNNHER